MVVTLLSIALWSCEDPEETFDPINPNLSADNVAGTIQSSERLLQGSERQLSILMSEIVVAGEIASDNYANTQTFFNQFLDGLDINPTDTDLRDIQFGIARLRALATAGIDEIGPADDGTTGEQFAGFYFLRGLSSLFAGEYFNRLPGEGGGATIPAEEHYANALTDFDAAVEQVGGGEYSDIALLARARLHYRMGNKTAAVVDATAVISATPDLIYFARYDANEGPTNTLQDAIYDRGSFDDLQPLPTLDFLDPKYNGATPNVEVFIPVLKVEEAHLILAEAALSEGNIDEAKSIMKNIVGLVATRPTQTFTDGAEQRTQRAPRSRPDTSIIKVSPGPDRPFESGLVLNRRSTNVTVPTVSGTSYTNEEIDQLNDIDFAYETLYRMRQEIFIAEGRRVTDLGIKYVVSIIEADANPNIVEGDLVPTIPPFLAPLAGKFDDITYTEGSTQATVVNNLNRLISANRNTALVAPFN